MCVQISWLKYISCNQSQLRVPVTMGIVIHGVHEMGNVMIPRYLEWLNLGYPILKNQPYMTCKLSPLSGKMTFE